MFQRITFKESIFEEVNQGTKCALGSEKYINRRTRFCSKRIFCIWDLAAWPPSSQAIGCQYSPEASAARFRRLPLLDKSAENYALGSVK